MFRPWLKQDDKECCPCNVYWFEVKAITLAVFLASDNVYWFAIKAITLTVFLASGNVYWFAVKAITLAVFLASGNVTFVTAEYSGVTRLLCYYVFVFMFFNHKAICLKLLLRSHYNSYWTH